MLVMRILSYILIGLSLNSPVCCSDDDGDQYDPIKGTKDSKRPRAARQISADNSLSVKVRVVVKGKGATAVKQPVGPQEQSLLFVLPDEVLYHLIRYLERPRHMAHLARTCPRLNNFIKGFPFAPCHFGPVLAVAVKPGTKAKRFRRDFIDQLRLDTIQGRSDFYKYITIEGFLKLVAEPAYGGCLLGDGYAKAATVVQGCLQSFLNNGVGNSVIMGNKFYLFPPDLTKLTYLKRCNFETSHCLALPRRIESLTLLNKAIVTNGLINHIPEGIGKLRLLEELDLSGNCIPCLPDSMSHLSSLRSLNVEGNRLREFPSCLLALTSLRSLRIGKNAIFRLPDNIYVMQGLVIFSMCNHQFPEQIVGAMRQLPFTFENMPALEVLELRGHLLSKLPCNFNSLSGLKSLDFGSNDFASFPEELLRLTGVQRLSLCANPLAAIPEQLVRMVSLGHLDLSLTRVTEIPENLKAIAEIIL